MMAVSGIDDDAKIVSIGPDERDSNAWCLPRGSKASEEASAGRPDADYARDEPDELVNGAAGRGGAGGGDDSEDDGDGGGRGIRFAGSEEDAARLFALLRGVLPPELLANVRFRPVGRRRVRQEEHDEVEGSDEEGSDDEESGSSEEGVDDEEEEEEEVAHEDIPEDA
jgi:hypothetical protein